MNRFAQFIQRGFYIGISGHGANKRFKLIYVSVLDYHIFILSHHSQHIASDITKGCIQA